MEPKHRFESNIVGSQPTIVTSAAEVVEAELDRKSEPVAGKITVDGSRTGSAIAESAGEKLPYTLTG